MAALWILAGIIWLIWALCKDASIKQVPKDTDFIQANNDYYSGRCSAKEMKKRMENGYYVNKK